MYKTEEEILCPTLSLEKKENPSTRKSPDCPNRLALIKRKASLEPIPAVQVTPDERPDDKIKESSGLEYQA